MPYPFTFDLSRISRPLFDELARLAKRLRTRASLKRAAKRLVEKLRLDVELGLKLAEAERVVNDLLRLYSVNERLKEAFKRAGRRALILPHCARKFMDSRCRASFDPSVPTYVCRGCSEDCLVRRAKEMAEAAGYDVYVIPGSSCLRKLLSRGYEAVVGVACPEEVIRAESLLAELGVAGQAVPLLRNGCANTTFSLEALSELLTT